MTTAIILAAGSGTRLGGEVPKQFLEVCGKTILEHTIEAFHCHDGIDEIAVVTREDYVDEVRRLTREYAKVRHVVPGGRERYHSTLAALNLYTCDDDLLLFHDCVRPLVSQRIITDCIAALRTSDAVGVGVPTTDTIWQTCFDSDLDSDSELKTQKLKLREALASGKNSKTQKLKNSKTQKLTITAIPPRATLYNAQTPQAFRRAVIRAAYDRALADPTFVSTDDCGVVIRYLPEVPIRVVQGETTNIKVTYREDLDFVAAHLTR